MGLVQTKHGFPQLLPVSAWAMGERQLQGRLTNSRLALSRSLLRALHHHPDRHGSMNTYFVLCTRHYSRYLGYMKKRAYILIRAGDERQNKSVNDAEGQGGGSSRL